MTDIKFGSIGFLIGFLLGWLFFWVSGAPFVRSPEMAVALVMALLLGLGGVFFGLIVSSVWTDAQRQKRQERPLDGNDAKEKQKTD